MAGAGGWPAELEQRRARVRGLVEQAGCDLAVVFGCDAHAEAFRYLTNFAPVLGDSWLLLGAETRCVLTFQWQIEEARALSGIERWEGAFDPIPLVLAALRAGRPRRIGLAGHDRMPAPAHRALVKDCRTRSSSISARLSRRCGAGSPRWRSRASGRR